MKRPQIVKFRKSAVDQDLIELAAAGHPVAETYAECMPFARQVRVYTHPLTGNQGIIEHTVAGGYYLIIENQDYSTATGDSLADLERALFDYLGV